MTKHRTDHSIVTPFYDRFDRASGVLASQWCKGQKQFLVQWAPTPCRVRHTPLHVELGYKVHCTVPYTGNQLDDAGGEETCLITWEPKWEAADSFCHAAHPEQKGRTGKPLAYKPQLRQYIHIDPNNTINPDQDIVANGTYTLGPVTNSASKEGPLVNSYNDEGKFMGTITQNRLAILHSAYCHTKQTAPETLRELHATNFVHEVAKLTLRYQAGQGKGAEKLPDESGLPDDYMHALIQSVDD
ncbi:TPA: hypothetical protein ACH3X1_015714 [Trebouxia sp. C0004]